MKFQLSTIALVAALLLGNQTVRSQETKKDTALTNAAVVKLSKAGFKEKTIISVIFARIPNFDLSPDRMIELKRSGVSEKIIVAMLARQEGSDFNVDDWGDDSFSSNSSDPKLDSITKPRNGDGNSTDLFGSGSEQKSRSQTNGSPGASSGSTMTTGSATVRILKPQSEAGEPTKLEKTKSLTNDSIVELVEAGFSEGTIIRRIEQSPVEFDLAAPKIEGLRKRRVSDKILNAMKTAMGGESTK